MLIGDRRTQWAYRAALRKRRQEDSPVTTRDIRTALALTLCARVLALAVLVASPFVADDLAFTLSWGFAFVGLSAWRV